MWLWACGQRVCVVQAKRHVHSDMGSGLAVGLWAVAAQAVAGELEPVGVVDEAVEDGVGVGGVAEPRRMPSSSIE